MIHATDATTVGTDIITDIITDIMMDIITVGMTTVIMTVIIMEVIIPVITAVTIHGIRQGHQPDPAWTTRCRRSGQNRSLINLTVNSHAVCL